MSKHAWLGLFIVLMGAGSAGGQEPVAGGSATLCGECAIRFDTLTVVRDPGHLELPVGFSPMAFNGDLAAGTWVDELRGNYVIVFPST